MDELIVRAIGERAEPGSRVVAALAARGAEEEGFALAAANHLAQAELFQAALAVLDMRIAAAPGSVQSLLTRAQISAHVGDREGCADSLLAVLKTTPTEPLAWSSLAHLVSGTVPHPKDPSSWAQEIASLLAARSRGTGGERGAQESSDTSRSEGMVARAALDLLHPAKRIVVVDAGARDAHRDPRWRLLPPDRLSYHGFEPDPPECDKLNAELQALGIAGAYYPVGLWDRQTRLPFHVNRAPGGSSFLRQNRAVTDRWKFENPTEISYARDIFVEERTVHEAVTDVLGWAKTAGIESIDFIKLNVQGGEIAIFEGMGSLLGTVQGVLVEVAFVESYLDRPLFGDVDKFLRNAGFTFFDLLAHHYIGRSASPFTARHAPGAEGRLSEQRSSWGQLIEGHALYLRDPVDTRSGLSAADEGSAPEADVARLAVVADVFGQTEYALELLAWAETKFRDRGDEETALRFAATSAQALRNLPA